MQPLWPDILGLAPGGPADAWQELARSQAEHHEAAPVAIFELGRDSRAHSASARPNQLGEQARAFGQFNHAGGKR